MLMFLFGEPTTPIEQTRRLLEHLVLAVCGWQLYAQCACQCLFLVMQVLVQLGLLTEQELESTIVTEFNPVRVGESWLTRQHACVPFQGLAQHTYRLA